MTAPGQAEAPEPFLDRREMAALLGVHPATLDRMRQRGCPSYRWGRRTVRFRASEVTEWLRACDGARAAA
jgi:excisionase family DNA binding protein